MNRNDTDGMRGMKSYLSLSETAVLAYLDRTNARQACPEILGAIPDTLAPKYRQGINNMVRGLCARGYVVRHEEPRRPDGPWIKYKITPEGRRIVRRLLNDLQVVAAK